MHNIKMVIAYDGTNYLGWQKTKMGASIQGSLEEVLTQILQHPVALQAASRTDAGVHAESQVVNFFTPANIDLGKLKHSLNRLLPPDIRIKSIQYASQVFHPTLDATNKEYHYYICYGAVQHPRDRLYSWHLPSELDVDAMREAAALLVGTHDFSSFCNFKKNSTYEHYMRTVQAIHIVKQRNHFLKIKISGHNFLYKMVRNIVGTLVYVGLGRIKSEQISHILQSRDRTQAGVTAPAHGLFLHKINYN